VLVLFAGLLVLGAMAGGDRDKCDDEIGVSTAVGIRATAAA
jgi:hypothetical protein